MYPFSILTIKKNAFYTTCYSTFDSISFISINGVAKRDGISSLQIASPVTYQKMKANFVKFYS